VRKEERGETERRRDEERKEERREWREERRREGESYLNLVPSTLRETEID
jgi:hypothetical protein